MSGHAVGLAQGQHDHFLEFAEDPGVSKDPRDSIASILAGQNPGRAITALVRDLSRPDYSIKDLLADIRHFKQQVAGAETTTERLIERWTLLDGIVEKCLAFTTFSHEDFFDTTEHAFCHHDSAGIILSANSKMLALDQHCLGKELPRYFGAMEAEVRQIVTTHARRLCELELRTGTGPLPVLAEFGTTQTDAHQGGYALLVDMSSLVEAEQKAFESAPYGMLKLDSRHRTLYASRKALDLLELSRDDLLGRDARRLITDKESLTTAIRQSVERRRGVGGQFEISYTTPKTNKPYRLRITSIPSFDAHGAFSGSIMQVQSINQNDARQRIAHLVATVSDHDKLYDGIVDILKGFVDFDWANLFVYSPNRDFSRIVCTRGPEIPFVSRWFATPAGYLNWLGEPNTWMDDFQGVMSQTSPEYLERTDTKTAIAAGMRALVCLPIRAGGRIIGGFCLISKQKGIYDAGSRALLEKLNLEQAFLRLFDIIETVEREFVSGLVRQIAHSEDMRDVAEKVVGELARFYQYQNVSIFKVNVLRGHVQLLAQALGPRGGTPMPVGYSQSTDEGVLGLCYRRGDCVILRDREDSSEEAKAYVQVAKEIRSELCIPIRLFNRVLWILNLEDCLGDAFTPIEVEKLQSLIQQMQATLERIFQGLILVKVLDVCPAAVVITDQRHSILRCNRQARQIMQQDRISEADNFEEFIDVPPATLTTTPLAATLLGAKGRGKKTQVLASRFTLEEEYDQAVFMLQNVADLEWTAKFETLRAALAETTAQVRVPVSLLSSFTQRIGQLTEDEKLQDLARKATRQLGRIELTYDRVLASYEAESPTVERGTAVDVKRALELILQDLPDLERKSIRLSEKLPDATIICDPYRVFFALSSMLAYLLRRRPNAEPIVITSRERDAMIEISMTGAVPKTARVRHLAAMIEATRAEIALGKDALVRIARNTGGDFSLQRQQNGRERLSLKLGAPAKEKAHAEHHRRK